MVDCSRLLFARRLCPEGYGQLTWGGSRGRCRRYFAVQHAIGGVAICRVDLIHTDWRLPGRFTRAHDSMLLLRMHQRPLCREHPARHACPSPSRVIKPTPGHSSRGMALTTSGSPWPRHTAGTPSGRGSVFHRSRYIQSAVGSTMSQQPCPPAYRLLHLLSKKGVGFQLLRSAFCYGTCFRPNVTIKAVACQSSATRHCCCRSKLWSVTPSVPRLARPARHGAVKFQHLARCRSSLILRPPPHLYLPERKSPPDKCRQPSCADVGRCKNLCWMLQVQGGPTVFKVGVSLSAIDYIYLRPET